METTKLVLVSGATGDLGRAYLDHFKKESNMRCYGISRRIEAHPLKNVNYLLSDLENSETTRKQINLIEYEKINSIILIHPVGRFKFEENGLPEFDKNSDSIDDEVYSSNIDTFHNIVRPLIENRDKYGLKPLTLVAFGSLSDSYNVPWWGSYSKSKLILRNDMKELSRLEKKLNSIFINLSSVKTTNEFKTRPYADPKYWVNPKEIVDRTHKLITEMNKNYVELDIFNDCPEYYEGYYKNYTNLKQKWQKEMQGIDG